VGGLTSEQSQVAAAVTLLRDGYMEALTSLLSAYRLNLRLVPESEPIPGTYWGDSEAGLIGDTVLARLDTPVHSILHEACHAICMGEVRRMTLSKDAGGDHAEENAVCYLQILLADRLPGFGSAQMCADMDAWGYTFRLGSARAWFEQDAVDARDWLMARRLLNESTVAAISA
jgi:hypothetical protein